MESIRMDTDGMDLSSRNDFLKTSQIIELNSAEISEIDTTKLE